MQFLDAIIKSFKFKENEYMKQLKIDKYRIDLYIPKYNLAIEIDDNNHNNYNKED